MPWKTGPSARPTSKPFCFRTICACRICSGPRCTAPPGLAAAWRSRYQSEPPQTATSAAAESLSGRESDILKLIAEGLSNSEIADQLVLSNATVKTHINRIFYKTGARDRAQAVRYAYQHRLA